MNNNNRLNDISRFHMYSVAIVAKDIEEDGFIVECFPIENMTHVDGDIAYVEGITVSNEDIDNEAEVIVLNKSVTIKAKWLALGHSNRKTAPMVKKGEQVMLFRYANEDEFYWMTMYNEFDLRRKEKVIHYYSNTDVFMENLHDDNTYWTKVDTINKEVSIHTSDNDGEHTTYDIMINTKKGVISIIDGKGNELLFDSSINTLTANIIDKIVFNTKIIEYNATNKMTITTPNLTMNANKWTTTSSDNTHNIGSVKYLGGTITHDDICIDKTHVHCGNLGIDTSPPKCG